ncbi:unnamed protein product [Candida verbasci]|uniref:Histone deacetylase complex subunit SAP30 Sin3 binding domain-containing protein n=1 Tax=Candida verbasci TaxID=1227364 RepID=A0A9W4TX83_9ASCO|nr:unnamed protein product [Candida verbasci]
MSRHKESTSEPETKQTKEVKDSSNNNNKTTQKQKNQLLLQQQQQFLQKHINSNGKSDMPKIDPLDFEKFNDKILLKYAERYKYNINSFDSLNNDILNSEIGLKTYSKTKRLREKEKEEDLSNKMTKKEFSKIAKNHFMSLPAKENDIITGFLYKVKNQDKEFKLTSQ